MRRSLPLVIVLAALVMTTGCKNKPPRIPTQPAGPETVLLNDTATYKSVTTDPNKDKVLYIFNWRDGKQDTTDLFASGDTVRKSHAWAETGYYAIRVKAKDDKGNYSADWSDSLLVHVLDTVNRPPSTPLKPVMSGPRWIDSLVHAAASSTDPDADSLWIKFFWGDGNVTTSAKIPSGGTARDSHAYSSRGSKFVRAMAVDVKSAMSDTSPAESIYIDAVNTAPGTPVFVRSANPRRGIADGPTYRFYARADDLQGDSIRYIFYWGTGDSSVSALTPTGLYGMGTFRPTGDTATYVMRVKAIDQFGLANATLGVDTFSTVNEGTIIWRWDDDFVASPAMGLVTSQGQDYPGILVGSLGGIVYFIDAYQSSADQVSQTDLDPFHSSPSIGANGRFYVGCDNGGLYAFTPAGETAWRYPDTLSDNDIATTPIVDGNAIYFGGEDWRIHKLVDNGSGWTEPWSRPVHNELVASPAMDPSGNIIVVDDSGYVTSFSPSGSVNWTVQTSSAIGMTSSPAISSNGTVYVGSDAGRLYAIKDGDTLWTYTTPGDTPSAIYSSPIIGLEGDIYFAADDGKLYRLNPATGDTVWTRQVSTYGISSTPCLCADGVFYMVDDDDDLWAVNPDGSTWSVDLVIPPAKGSSGHRPRPFTFDSQSSPMVDQYGIIYVCASTGVFAVAGGGSGGSLASTQWPMFHHDIRHTGKYGTRK